MVLEWLDIHLEINEDQPLPHTVYTNYLWWIINLNVEAQTIKPLEEKRREIFCVLGVDKDFLDGFYVLS